MPVPKGVDAKKYDRCVEDVKRKQGKKVNAYAVCASSLKKTDKTEKCMDAKMMKEKIKKSLLEKFEGKELTEELKGEIKTEMAELVKALTAGYDSAEPDENVKQVENGPTLTAPAPQPEAASTAPAPAAEAPKAEPKEVKFSSSLFKPFALGAILKPGPSGNVMSNMKPSSADYVKMAENTKNVKMTGEQLSKLKSGK